MPHYLISSDSRGPPEPLIRWLKVVRRPMIAQLIAENWSESADQDLNFARRLRYCCSRRGTPYSIRYGDLSRR